MWGGSLVRACCWFLARLDGGRWIESHRSSVVRVAHGSQVPARLPRWQSCGGLWRGAPLWATEFCACTKKWSSWCGHASHVGRDGLLRHKGGRSAFFNGGATATQGLRVRVGCGGVQWHGCAGDEGEGPGAAKGEWGFFSCIAGCERGCELAAAVWLHPRAYGAWETCKNGAAGVDGKGRGTRSDTGKQKEWFGVVVVV